MKDINSNKLLISLVLAVMAYAGKYYYDFGQWCPAMWGGTYPPIFIGIATTTIYRLLSIADIIVAKRQEREARLEDEFQQSLKMDKQTNHKNL